MKKQILTTIVNLIDNEYIFIFLTVIIVDIITGILKGIYNKKLN